MLENLLENIFSIQNEMGSRKVIKLFGIRFKFHNMKSELSRQAYIHNKSICTGIYRMLKTADESDLFCMRTGDLIFIFNRGCLDISYKFFQDYILTFGYSSHIFEIIELDKDSVLYKEHINRIQNGEFLWKYVKREYFIAHSFISKDLQTGEIYINTSYVKESTPVLVDDKFMHVPRISKRKYIKGVTVGDYLRNKSLEEREQVIENLLDFVFTTYRAEDDSEKVSGDLLDCHLYNFLLGEDGQFHFIDFDLKSVESLDRNYCIYFMLYRYDMRLYERMLKKYGFKDRHNYWAKNFSVHNQPKKGKKAVCTEEHKELCRKYFTDAGFEAEYQVAYKKVLS